MRYFLFDFLIPAQLFDGSFVFDPVLIDNVGPLGNGQGEADVLFEKEDGDTYLFELDQLIRS